MWRIRFHSLSPTWNWSSGSYHLTFFVSLHKPEPWQQRPIFMQILRVIRVQRTLNYYYSLDCKVFYRRNLFLATDKSSIITVKCPTCSMKPYKKKKIQYLGHISQACQAECPGLENLLLPSGSGKAVALNAWFLQSCFKLSMHF